jgi:glycerate kinase
VRVVIAPDCFTGTLTAPQAAQALADGWRRHAPDDELDLCPMSDGGPGFVDALHAALGGELVPVVVPGPLGEPVPAAILLHDGTAYLESAQACGLDLIPLERRDPGLTGSVGVGVLLAQARAAGARRIVVGLGGSATNDGGAGMLAGLASSLGVDVDPGLAGGGAGLRGMTAARLAGLPELRAAFTGIELVAASDVDVVLLGFKGASAIFAEQKGATPEQAQALDLALSDFARSLLECTDPPGAQRLVAEPGAGAAGGLGFGLLWLGARREAGAATVAAAVGLGGRLAGAGLVVTGEGCLDWQSLRGKVVTAVAKEALELGVPAVAVAGQVLVGRRELLNVGVESAYPVARNPAEVAASLADPAGRLAARAERVARTWSPRRGE